LYIFFSPRNSSEDIPLLFQRGFLRERPPEVGPFFRDRLLQTDARRSPGNDAPAAFPEIENKFSNRNNILTRMANAEDRVDVILRCVGEW